MKKQDRKIILDSIRTALSESADKLQAIATEQAPHPGAMNPDIMDLVNANRYAIGETKYLEERIK